MKEQKAAAPPPAFMPSRLQLAGAKLWIYRHDGAMPPELPDGFWRPARNNYGMKDGDVVVFTAGREVKLLIA